jgi:hypothetical protein
VGTQSLALQKQFQIQFLVFNIEIGGNPSRIFFFERNGVSSQIGALSAIVQFERRRRPLPRMRKLLHLGNEWRNPNAAGNE